MEIEVTVSGLLRDCTRGQASFTIASATLDDALRRMLETYPLLRIHHYDEAGQLRPRVLIFYNAENIAWLEQLDTPRGSGDQIDILQAVSGG